MPDSRLADYRRRLAARRKQNRFVVKRINVLKAAVAKRKKQLAHQDAGIKALHAAATMLGKTETSPNDSPWLRQMEAELVKAGFKLDWMIPGQPYCGMGCIWAWFHGAGVRLPDGTVYTPNICPWGGKTVGKVRFVRVPPEQAKPGALVVMDFAPGSGADHVALARGPMRNGVIPTRDFNTSSGNSGSQANGGGVYDRLRPRAFVLCTLNVVPV